MTIRAVMSLLLVSVVAVSCAHVRVTGQDFSTAGFSTLRLRETTPQQVEALAGPPFKRMALQTTANKPGGAVPVGTPISLGIMNYVYVLSNGGAAASGRPVGKTATLVFWNGTLAAYDLNSSIPGEENPPIDEFRLAQLHQGITTRDDIIGLMGTPSGQSIALANVPKALGHVSYVWTHFDGPSLRHKVLVFDLNSNDVMTHYTLVDGEGPLPVLPMVPPPPGVVPYIPPYQRPQQKSAPPIVIPKAPIIRS